MSTTPHGYQKIETLISDEVAEEIDAHAWRRSISREEWMHMALMMYLAYLNDYRARTIGEHRNGFQ